MDLTTQRRPVFSASIALTLVTVLGAGCEPESSAKEGTQVEPAKAAAVAPPAKADEVPAHPEPVAKAEQASPEATPEPVADPGVLTIAKFGLEAEVTGAKAEDSPGDAVIVRGPDLTMRLAKATDGTYASAKKAKQMSAMLSPKDWKAKEVDGGYVATFKRSASGTTSYWVRGYRTIGDTAYDCSTTVETEAEATNAAALCEALTSSASG